MPARATGGAGHTNEHSARTQVWKGENNSVIDRDIGEGIVEDENGRDPDQPLGLEHRSAPTSVDGGSRCSG